MAAITIQQVLNATRDKLSDNAAVSAGRIVTDSEFLQFLQLALLEMNQILRVVDTPFTRREITLLITPNVNRVPIGTAPYITDMSQFGEITERKVVSHVAISNVAAVGDLLTFTTVDPHGLGVGDDFEIVETALQWLDGSYVASVVPLTTTVIAAGIAIRGAVGASTGFLVRGQGAWSPVVLTDNLVPLEAPVESVSAVQMGDNGLRFNPVIGYRELKIECFPGVAAIPSLSDTLLIPDSIQFLAGRCALEAHSAKGGNPERIAALRRELYGVSEDPANIEGGSAGLLRRGYILQSQWKRRIRRRFRDVRQPHYPAFVRF